MFWFWHVENIMLYLISFSTNNSRYIITIYGMNFIDRRRQCSCKTKCAFKVPTYLPIKRKKNEKQQLVNWCTGRQIES